MQIERESIKNYFTKVLQEFTDLKTIFKKEITDFNLNGSQFKDSYVVK